MTFIVRTLTLLLFPALLTLAAAPTPATAFSFEENAACQEVVERFYHSHRVGTSRSFEEVFSRELLEDRVRDTRARSAALARLWHTEVSTAALLHEQARIEKGTRFPERLRDLYAALGNDPVRIRECFVRPVLVRRLTENFFAFDERFQGEAVEEAKRLRERLRAGAIDPRERQPRRRLLIVHRKGRGGDLLPGTRAPGAEERRIELDAEAFRTLRARGPTEVLRIGRLEEDASGYVIRVVLEEGADHFAMAAYTIPKVSWSEWWAEARPDLEDAPGLGAPAKIPRAPGASGGPSEPPPPPEPGPCVRADTWDNGILDDVPDGRSGHTAVWTGNLMIVWGGEGYATGGGRYDPLTDTWSPMSTVNAPSSPRDEHTAVWTGQEMIIWGGGGYYNTGGRYDPVADRWEPTSTVNAPAGREGHTAVWTGQEMIVWGGKNPSAIRSGGRYDPSTDTWRYTAEAGAPSARYGHEAVWTGTEMIVWGGYSSLDTGGIYNPATETWRPMTTTDAPVGRWSHAAVWTGSEMIVWGGKAASTIYRDTGGRYDPQTDTWQPTSMVGAPERREAYHSVWTGTELIVWGGFSTNSTSLDTGGRYDPVSDTWTPTSTIDAPAARGRHAAVWTGELMIVWGGYNSVTGGRYDPELDFWTPVATTQAPRGRWRHHAVWTGNVMIIWGGERSGVYLTEGSRYDPLTDSWTALPTAGEPSPRSYATAVWTGRFMLVWGGGYSSSLLETGAGYDVVLDRWAPITTVGAPAPRVRHSAVWTGEEMIVWGGGSDTGGMYDPETDLWTPTSVVGAPTARFDHTAVWTGEEMIVWGGSEVGAYEVDTGGRYDPSTDTWTPTSMVDVPRERERHTAVWTGSRMFVWGGTPYASSGTDTGGLYDPSTDTWQPTTLVGAPSKRSLATGVWTGSEVLVWGGSATANPTNTGARYDPALDAWQPISDVAVPSPRTLHSAVWTGEHMMVWGGGSILASGGRYAPYVLRDVDDDGDGYTACTDDCDDDDAGIHPDATELCDGLDEDCDGIVPADEVDDDGDGVTDCGGDCDDADGYTYPGATERCDFLDNDCDGVVPPAELDGDDDGYAPCEGDCDDGSPARFPGNPEVCDGLDNDCNGTVDGFATACGLGQCVAAGVCVDGVDSCLPGEPSMETCDGLDNDCDGVVPPAELDGDGDGATPCEGDCDDGSAVQFPGNPEVCDGLDNDCDGTADSFPTACGVGECAAEGTCLAGVDSCSPGEPSAEICDGLDNDCNGTVPGVEADQDADGVRICAGDCDDADFDTWPDAPEVNDGKDNQCAGAPGAGIVDEVSGLAGFPGASAPFSFCWTPQDGATGYEVVRSDDPAFPSDCGRTETDGPCWSEGPVPPVGQAHFLLVRSLVPNEGSWGYAEPPLERTGVCGGEVCDDGIDNDGDTLADCDDPDCQGTASCSARTFILEDGLGDDAVDDAVELFFGSFDALPTDFILFRVETGGDLEFEWCAERADFFQDSYLALAAGGGSAASGGWQVWHRLSGGSWGGPDVDTYTNYYGGFCFGPYSWCSEAGLGGRIAGVDPAYGSGQACEIHDAWFGCGDGSEVLTLRVGRDRLSTCGF